MQMLICVRINRTKTLGFRYSVWDVISVVVVLAAVGDNYMAKT